MIAPSSLTEALTASKLARTTQLAWESAYHGKVMPEALADALDQLIHAGDQATAAGVVMLTAQQIRSARAATDSQTKASAPRFDLSADVDWVEIETGLSVAHRGLESNRGKT